MNELTAKAIVEKQRIYFRKGRTLSLRKREAALKALYQYIKQHEKEINGALKKDLGKSSFEGFMCETGIVLSEITYMLRHMKKYAQKQKVRTPLAQFRADSYRKPSPYGVTLIMSPWNYPFLLTIEPLVDALAAGNTAVIKPSAYSPETSAVIEKMIEELFNDAYVTVVTGGRQENQCLLQQHFDYIFFTGSQAVGKEVMAQAAQYLTPVTLELGGKSPCIVEKSADISRAAKRIVFGKYLNCGQTCVAPDYVLCDASVHDALITEIKKEIQKQFGKEPLRNKNYGKIINEKHFLRLKGLMDAQKLVHGGRTDEKRLRIEPSVFDGVTFEDAIMQEEIFGPLLPVITYQSLESVVTLINDYPHPLALYLFTSDQRIASMVTSRCSFGGGCINDTIIHLATSEMGFGGFGESGMGSYHGKAGFDTFSHYKSIVDKKTWIDLPMRYQPYKKINELLIHFFLR